MAHSATSTLLAEKAAAPAPEQSNIRDVEVAWWTSYMNTPDQHLTSSNGSELSPVDQPLSPIPMVRSITPLVVALPRFDVRQQFEGTVLSRDEGVFVARIRDLTNPENPAEIAEFSMEDVSDSDHSLVKTGNVFYLTIGYRVQPWGQRERSSMLVFRRLPAWSRSDLVAVSHQAKEWDYMLHDDLAG